MQVPGTCVGVGHVHEGVHEGVHKGVHGRWPGLAGSHSLDLDRLV